MHPISKNDGIERSSRSLPGDLSLGARALARLRIRLRRRRGRGQHRLQTKQSASDATAERIASVGSNLGMSALRFVFIPPAPPGAEEMTGKNWEGREHYMQQHASMATKVAHLELLAQLQKLAAPALRPIEQRRPLLGSDDTAILLVLNVPGRRFEETERARNDKVTKYSERK
jgi:hypothetical protein